MESSGEKPDIGDKIEAALNKPISRRELGSAALKVTGGVAAAGVVAGAEAKWHPIKKLGRRLGLWREGHEAEREIVSWVEDPQAPWPKSVKVGIDAEGLPVKSILPSGEEVRIAVAKSREARERAKHTQEPELCEIVKVPLSPEERIERENRWALPHEFSEAHPEVEKLPEDILSEEELKEKGVTVVPTGKVQLHIRRDAFNEGGPLHVLNNSEVDMTIVLVDGPVVTSGYLNDPAHKPFQHLLGARDSKIVEYRQRKIEEMKNSTAGRAGYEHYFGEFLAGRGEYPDFYANILLDAKAQVPLWEKYMSDEEAYMYMLSSDETKYGAGLYYRHGPIPQHPEDVVLFVSAGSSNFTSDLAYLYFDHEDKLKVRTRPLELRNTNYVEQKSPLVWDFTPNSSQTHPDPETFHLNPDASPSNPNSYPYAGQTPGLVLRHEIGHHELNFKDPAHPNTSEYDTDMRAMRGIREAWERWTASGYKDDLGYNFVFKTPKGIILT
jgi:hypothetical protein